MRRQALILGPLLALAVLVFGAGGDSSAAEPLFYLTDYFSADAAPVDVISADFDGDGVADLAAANNMSDNISVLLGNGDGTFAPAVNYGAGNDSNSITICDLNGDGDPDLAVANGSNSVSILSGNGDGTFTVETGMDFNGSFEHCPTSVCCADFDADGNMDLAVAQSATEDWGIDIYLGNGDFTFSGQGRIGTPYGPRSVISADFDGDGSIDLAAAANLMGDMSIILGNGDGTFASAVNYAAGDGSCSIKGADFDLDGNIDLAVANEYSEDISTFLGNGDGTFTSADNYICWAMPSSIGGGDFDNDGDYDLAVANRGISPS